MMVLHSYSNFKVLTACAVDLQTYTSFTLTSIGFSKNKSSFFRVSSNQIALRRMISIVVICVVLTSATSQMTGRQQQTNCTKLQNDCPSLFAEQIQQFSDSLTQSQTFTMIDYGEIEEMINSRLREGLELQAAEMTQLAITIEQGRRVIEDLCPVSYNGKCFLRIIREPGGLPITREQSERICNDRGGKLANIYSENHYYQLMDYLRTFIPDGKSYMYYWTGMTWKSQSLFLSDESAAPFMKSISSFPWAGHDSTFIAIYVRKSPRSSRQHMANLADGTAFGAICEI